MTDELVHRMLGVPYKLNVKTVRKGRSPQATVIFLHGLASTKDLWMDIVKQMPTNVRVMTVDLLGHGNSPRPDWTGAQTLSMQARALKRSLSKAGVLIKPIILVGHSLGGLVAAEFARKYPHKIDSLILVSPPVYNPDDKTAWPREKILKKGYDYLIENQQFASKLARFATKNFIKGANEIKSKKDFYPLIESLKISIINQDTYQTLKNIKVETKIIYGIFDPLVIGKNIKSVVKYNSLITAESVPASHDIIGPMKKFVIKMIDDNLEKKEKNE